MKHVQHVQTVTKAFLLASDQQEAAIWQLQAFSCALGPGLVRLDVRLQKLLSTRLGQCRTLLQPHTTQQCSHLL